MEKKKHKHSEPENEEIPLTNKNFTTSENLINMNETDENTESPPDTVPEIVLNDQPYIETVTSRVSRQTVSTNLTSPDLLENVREMGIHMTKRSRFDEKEFARSVSIDETYYSSVVQPLNRFYTCILLFIAI